MEDRRDVREVKKEKDMLVGERKGGGLETREDKKRKGKLDDKRENIHTHTHTHTHTLLKPTVEWSLSSKSLSDGTWRERDERGERGEWGRECKGERGDWRVPHNTWAVCVTVCFLKRGTDRDTPNIKRKCKVLIVDC